MLNLIQTKFIGLTMKLDLKVREYNILCNKLEELKKENIHPNDKKLIELKKLFQKNQEEIVKLKSAIQELEETITLKEKEELEKYNSKNLFNKK